MSAGIGLFGLIIIGMVVLVIIGVIVAVVSRDK